MNRYTVTMELPNRDAFNHFVDNVGPMVENLIVSVRADPNAQDAPEAVPTPKPRPARGSKVNDTILAAIGTGNATIKDLKGALEGAGLSPGSLSTGIATLQKTGAIERVGDGLYALTAQAA